CEYQHLQCELRSCHGDAIFFDRPETNERLIPARAWLTHPPFSIGPKALRRERAAVEGARDGRYLHGVVARLPAEEPCPKKHAGWQAGVPGHRIDGAVRVDLQLSNVGAETACVERGDRRPGQVHE